MFNRVRIARESQDVRAVLVARMADGVAPVALMSLTFVVFVGYIAVSIHSAALIIVTVFGFAFSLAKLGVMLAHRGIWKPASTRDFDVNAWEWAHIVTSLGSALMIGLAVLFTFSAEDISLHMLMTGLVYGYGAGVVSRVSTRPALAAPLLMITCLPATIAAGLNESPAHWILAGALAMFLLASLESVRHMHLSHAREIGMRLDMATLARTDPLTGLANRFGLRLAFREIPDVTKKTPMVVIHCFDLDRFKPVNDCHGHAVGDELLKMVAARVLSLLRESDLAARTGGDEFVVLQSPVHRLEEADLFARRLWRAITSVYSIDGIEITIGASIGYATSPPDARELDSLLATADAALYRMKDGTNGAGDSDPRWIAA